MATPSRLSLVVLSCPLLRSAVRTPTTRFGCSTNTTTVMSIPSLSFLRHPVRAYHDQHTSSDKDSDSDPNASVTTTTIPSRLYKADEAPSLAELAALCNQPITQRDYPLSTTISSNIPLYDLSRFSPSDNSSVSHLQDEWAHNLLSGPGVFVVQNLYPDPSVIAAANTAFDLILAVESSSPTNVKGDHFAASSANARIWNAFGKHALAAPESFATYYSNPWLPAIAAAWLGPASRLTAQLNIVRPGGAPQTPHRDYHLGFQSATCAAAFPKPLHAASALLTLQGAVAHSAMPLASGPTRFLPGSQRFAQGYMAARRPEFAEFFERNWVSLPLGVGDGVFFSPALMHAAGRNETEDLQRSANLLQISAAFGKPMESVDALPIVKVVWPYVMDMAKAGTRESEVQVEALLSHLGEGYPFPTNLDRRPPGPGGMAPESEVEVLRRGVREGWGTAEVVAQLEGMREAGRA
ncbi:uncharacterized protein K452DRAFT_291902 [Aplosporella prunicola CBS 121167]|uniref:Phytanoyl-CoA dioxygenase n=1 Tax=Aplosporella prunicola CBS 121167 TaxID=1176127 RepID=A0A6A6B0M4_9PEZI|nr:uncharacterized protein K452DRAFT_292177 [Aplosporella prunicola CBS 121167]XP_033392701.1 uncharacterized protein K452DRAFT_291902 [Aplosporella prunicola CBS 121167]KAF2136746.1 hypothetical protein K452DRAFT_292177 [Aplosporella prunicola CBS 121167]KAF2136983.1 hypothetical protein K452DRAFT_291902 [Aplosporella prunicola CBS 121167]